jgi:gamma-glutamylcyclotransferase (GGCT)/AIG2-like uncharacterized protein YtfP
MGTARIQARLYRVKWYPGIRLSEAGDEWVVGDVFQLRDPSTLAALDEYEGSSEYRRVLAAADLENGDRVRCWVYEYIGPVSEDRRIVSGDWMAEKHT